MSGARRPLTDLLGVEHALVQAPMAGVQGSGLAVAVSNAGALGSLPCAMLDAARLRAELDAIRAGTTKSYNVNFFVHAPPVANAAIEARWRERLAPYYAELGVDVASIPLGAGRAPFDDEMADVLEDFRPPVVSFHFGLPSASLVARVRSWDAIVLASARTLDEGLWLEANGVDVVIAQGVEAGGHRGVFLTTDLATQVGTFALVPQLARALTVPVVAAGGIADAASVRAALTLGAAGVQVGSAYLQCPEATTTAVHRAALASDAARHTVLANVFTGRPARAIVNRFVRECGPIVGDAPAFPLASAALVPLRAAAERAGSGDFSPLWSGQRGGEAQAVPAADVTASLLTTE